MTDFAHFGFPAGDRRLARIAEGLAPAWLWTADGAQLLWANPAGASALGISSPVETTRGSLQAVGQQIARIVPWLSYSGPPRLERVRGLGDGIGSALTCACSRLQLDDGSTAVLVVSAETRPAKRKPDTAATSPGEVSTKTTFSGRSLRGGVSSAAESDRSSDEEKRRPLRFTWQTDEDGTLTLSPDFAAMIGIEPASLAGKSWSELCSAFALDPERRLARALLTRDTFSGIAVDWPIDGAGDSVQIELSGLPVFDSDRGFCGFRGFGLCRNRPGAVSAEHRSERDRDELKGAQKGRITQPPTLTLIPPSQNVVPFRGANAPRPILTALERTAFTEIAQVLSSQVEGETAPQPSNETASEPDDGSREAGNEDTEHPAQAFVPSAFASAASGTQDADSPSASSVAEAENRELRSILDTATDGVIVVGQDGMVLSVNRSAEALFGYDAHKLTGTSFLKLFAPESHQAALDYLEGLTRAGVASLLNDGREVIGRVREGGLIPLFMTMGRIEGSREKFCLVLRDMTAWKRAEEELVNAKRIAEKSSSAKSDFLAKISHEIRTPLNAIIGFSEVMIEERFGPIGTERYRDYLRDIQVSGQHLISLVNDLLDLSKIEAGKLDLSFASVRINELVQECVALMQPQANRERIIIRSSLAPALPPVVVDARSIRQIMLNLLSNSIKFTGPGGQVIVSTAFTERGEVVLRVRDTGSGMTEKEIETAMEPFRQLSTSDRWGSGGTGLGLPLTKALAEANRASFAIRSAGGAGTLVEITFPSTRVLAE